MFPQEIFEHIFKFCTADVLALSRGVNKTFAVICQSLLNKKIDTLMFLIETKLFNSNLESIISTGLSQHLIELVNQQSLRRLLYQKTHLVGKYLNLYTLPLVYQHKGSHDRINNQLTISQDEATTDYYRSFWTIFSCQYLNDTQYQYMQHPSHSMESSWQLATWMHIFH